MEFVEGIREKDTLELRELLKKQETDGEILVEGTVHSIRKMGEIAFVILRKREGLLQTVWEEAQYAEKRVRLIRRNSACVQSEYFHHLQRPFPLP